MTLLTAQSKELVEAVRLILSEFPNARVNINLTLGTEASSAAGDPTRLCFGPYPLTVRATNRATRTAPVYRSPSLHTPVIAHLADGQTVTASGEALGEFIQISAPAQGWVESALLVRERE